MANTIIQIKRSSITTQPASLQAAEPAYSYLSDKLFLGDASGAVIEIGGRFYINAAAQSWNTANAAFSAANAAFAKANTVASDADEKANAAIITANASFDAANAAFAVANNVAPQIAPAFNAANAAFNTANIAISNVNYVNTATKAAYDFANTVYSNYAYPAFVAVGPAFNAANAAFAQGNTTLFPAVNAAFGKANSAETIAIAAYQNSNTKLATTGGTITGDLAITGNLVISGNTTYVNVNELQVSDPLIYLAGNNYLADIVDIGFIANYVNATGANVHTGLYREHENKMYYLFQGYDKEPANNHIGAMSNNMTLAVLNADLVTSNLTLAGINALSRIATVFDAANNSGTIGSSAFAAANAAFAQGNTTVTSLGANWTATNSAFGQANTALTAASAAFANANSAGVAAASAFDAANAAFVQGNTTATATSSAFAQANTAYTVSNSAFAQANAASAQAANADFLTTGTVASARISGSYTGITGVGTLTVGEWQANTINVNYGGTGLSSISNNAILYATGSTTKLSTATGSDGNVLQINSHGTPFFGMLDGGAF